MSNSEITTWFMQHFDNPWVLQGWIRATMGRQFESRVNWNNDLESVVCDILTTAQRYGELSNLREAIGTAK